MGLYLFWNYDIPCFMQGGHVLSRISYVYPWEFWGGGCLRLGYGTLGGREKWP